MKVKRVKRAQKVLTFFKHNYKITPPYKVIVDGTFCVAALSNQLNLREQIPKYLGAETEIITSACVIKELEQIGRAVYGGLAVCRRFEAIRCPHMPFQGASDCFIRLAKKAKTKGAKYIFATQDPDLTEKLRAIPGIPILYINRTSILLEKQSEASIRGIHDVEPEIQKLNELKKEVFGEEEKVKRKRKIKGVNPLSCKKKKPKLLVEKTKDSSEKTANGKRRRKKVKKEGVLKDINPGSNPSVVNT